MLVLIVFTIRVECYCSIYCKYGGLSIVLTVTMDVITSTMSTVSLLGCQRERATIKNGDDSIAPCSWLVGRRY